MCSHPDQLFTTYKWYKTRVSIIKMGEEMVYVEHILSPKTPANKERNQKEYMNGYQI